MLEKKTDTLEIFSELISKSIMESGIEPTVVLVPIASWPALEEDINNRLFLFKPPKSIRKDGTETLMGLQVFGYLGKEFKVF